MTLLSYILELLNNSHCILIHDTIFRNNNQNKIFNLCRDCKISPELEKRVDVSYVSM